MCWVKEPTRGFYGSADLRELSSGKSNAETSQGQKRQSGLKDLSSGMFSHVQSLSSCALTISGSLKVAQLPKKKAYGNTNRAYRSNA
jgi:hypothetical protein